MKVKVQNVRVAFAQSLYEAKPFEDGQEPTYGCTLLMAPDSAARKAIDEAIQAVAVEKWGKKAQAVLDSIEGNPQKICFYDGKKKSYDGFEGNYALGTKRNEKDGAPLLLDTDKSPLVDKTTGKPYKGKEGRLYSGCYVNASVEIWAQDNKYGKGMRCTLNGVQFFRDGDSFGGTTKPDEGDFDDLGEGAESDQEDALA